MKTDILQAVIVEDELRAANTLKRLINDYCENVEILAIAHSVSEGVKTLEKFRPQLVFLDIEMQTGTGFDLLRKVDNLNFEVVFTTAYEHYALKAIKFSAIDYLLKPIDWQELQEAVAKVREKIQSAPNDRINHLLQNITTPSLQQTITLSTNEGYEFIRVEEIIRLEAGGSYTSFYLKDGRKIMVSRHLKEYEQLLSHQPFFRVHQSHLVNLTQVEKMVRQDGGYLLMKDGAQVDIAQKKREEFLRLMKETLN